MRLRKKNKLVDQWYEYLDNLPLLQQALGHECYSSPTSTFSPSLWFFPVKKSGVEDHVRFRHLHHLLKITDAFDDHDREVLHIDTAVRMILAPKKNNTPATKLRGVNLAFPCHRRDTSFFLHSIDTACRKSWTTMFNH